MMIKCVAYGYVTKKKFAIVVGSTQMVDRIDDLLEIGVSLYPCDAFTLDELVEAAMQDGVWTLCAKHFQEEFVDLNLQEGQMEATSVNLATPSDRQKLVERKAYYAGSSARWTFKRDTKDVKSSINYHVQKVQSSDELKKGDLGAMSSPAVNHLMVPVKGRSDYTIVSPYALNVLLLNGASPKLSFQVAHELFKNEPAALGWLIEVEYISDVKAQHEVLFGAKPFPEALTDEQVNKVKQGVRVEPDAFNQGALDLLQVTKKRVDWKVVHVITMTQVTKQVKAKSYDAELILKTAVKIASKLDLDPSRLGIRIITQMPRTVIDDRSDFDPTVTALKKCGMEDYKQTIEHLAPKPWKKAFKKVAENFSLKHGGNKETLETVSKSNCILCTDLARVCEITSFGESIELTFDFNTGWRHCMTRKR